jgi:hypothetical protein
MRASAACRRLAYCSISSTSDGRSPAGWANFWVVRSL